MLTFPDRFWWLQRAWGLLLAIGGFIAAIYEFIQGYDAYNVAQAASSGPLDTALLRDLAALLRNDAQEILLSGLMWVIFVVLGILYILKSVEAQQRFRRRLHAIEGRQNAMPRASVKVDTSSAAELSSEPLEWLRRSTPSNRRIMTTLIIIFLLIFSPFIVLFLYLAYCVATNTVPIGSTGLEPISPLERVGLVAVTVFVAALLLFLIGFLISRFPSERGRPYGVVASNEGLWYYPQVGKRRFLRWEEFRLFEVIPSGNGRHYQQYKLYSGNAIAAWSNYPPSSILLSGLAMQEFAERHQTLLNLIAARTHLLPRTFDKKLAEAGEAPSVTRRQDG